MDGLLGELKEDSRRGPSDTCEHFGRGRLRAVQADEVVDRRPRVVDAPDLHVALALVWREFEPLADALPRRDAADFERRVRLPLDHRDVAVLGVLPNGARRRRRLGHDAVRDALLRPEHGTIEHRGVEVRERERDAVGLHGAWHRGRDWQRRKRAKDRGFDGVPRLGTRPAALCVGVHVESH